MEKVLLIGGTGLVGKHLCSLLQDAGYTVSVLSRSKEHISDIAVYTYNIEENKIDVNAIKNADYIINLAGANVGGKRWTKKRKKLIIESRTKTTEFIFKK